MAEVFLGVRGGVAGFTRLLVIKRLRTDLADVADLERHRGLMLDEARLAARLRHPNIVQTFEVDLEGGSPQIAMEYLEGQALSGVVTAARKAGLALSAPMALAVIDGVLAALAYAHDLADYDGEPLGVVHRDVSPQNIFWTYDGEIKLMDFGVAKFARGRAATEAGTIKGKLTYMAPEQARGAAIDRRADLFACGIVMWELLAGKRLFRADSEAASLNRLLFEPLPPLEKVRPGIDPALAAICARALQRAPDARYESAAAMRADLARAMDEHAPRREDLAAYVQPLFVGERRAVAARIREALAGGDAAGPLPSLVDEAGHDPEPASSKPDRTLDETVQARPPSSIMPSRVAPGAPTRNHGALVGAFVAVAAASGGVIAWQEWKGGGEPAAALAAPAPATAKAPAPAAAATTPALTYDLTLCGSNTIGAELAPALVEAYLAHEGAIDVARAPGATDEHVITARLRGLRVAIDVRARGSATAFEGLAAAACDVGMASRAIDDGEVAKLGAAGLGDLRSPATEHVIALDGIAVIVHPNNPIAALDRQQLHDVFTGKVRDWKDVGGAPGPIDVIARDDKSGTYDTFKNLVLGKDPLASGATRLAASDALADAVAGDPQAIGFIGLAYVRTAKAIAVGDVAAPPMLPTSFTVTTEGYMLARRLYWYTTPRPRSPRTAELVNFALSSDGQAAVARAGFVDLSVSLAPAPSCDEHCPRRYAHLIAHAQRVALDFRFRYGSDDLDSRATRDLDRVVQFLRGQPGARLYLLGFSDASGGGGSNLALSIARAKTIARDLEMRGVHPAIVDGFGDALPVASNATELDRQRNRRVEVWLAPP